MNYRAFFDEIKAGAVRPVYLLHGEEEYVKDRALERLTGLLSPDFCEFNLSIMDDPAAGDIASAAEQLPVLDERRIVLVKNSRLLAASKKDEQDAKKGDSGKDEKQSGEKKEEQNEANDAPVLQYLKKPNPSTVLVFLARGKCDARKKIFKTIAETGGVVEFNLLSEQELLPWLTKFAANKGGTLGRREAAHLISVTGRDLLTLTTELEKVLSYANGAPVSREMIDRCVAPDVEKDVFRAMDELLAGNKKNALLILRSAIEKGGNGAEYAVLPAIAYKIRTLADNKRAGKRDAFSKMFTRKELDDALVALADLDYRMKSETVDAKSLIERTVLGIFAGKK
ncbi:MAG: DNA polymerase III subunit delta [Christensenellales bacterium]|jgi:DNA polymerase-3 subunit delta